MPYFLNRYYPARNVFFVLGEGLIIFLTINLVSIYFYGPTLFAETMLHQAMRAMVVTLIFTTCLYYFDLYDFSSISGFADTASRATRALGVGCILLGIIYFIFPASLISTRIFWSGYLIICLGIACWRLFYMIVLDKKMFAIPVLLVGGGILAEKIVTAIGRQRDSGYKIVACASMNPPFFQQPDLPVHTGFDTLPDIAHRSKAEKIVVALDDRRGKMPARQLLACKLAGFPIVDGLEFFEEMTGKIIVEKVTPGWVIFTRGFQKNRLTELIKAITDRTLATVGILLLLPLGVTIGLLIKLASSGPIFYTQERIGKHDRLFRIIKFRSMCCDAEPDGQAVWASENDTRITRIGRFLRKYRLDEIPQLWNVLKGEMSLVGPRPERPVFVDQLNKSIPYYSLRHNVKPGITGWAQVCFRYGDTESAARRKLEYDLYYVKNISFWFDMLILFQTGKIVLFKRGAR